MPSSTKCISVVVVKLILYYKIGCYSLYYMHFLIQVFNFSDVVLYRFVKEGSIRCNITV